jgi:hypothetical protein
VLVVVLNLTHKEAGVLQAAEAVAERLAERRVERQVEVVRGNERAPEVEVEHVPLRQVPRDQPRVAGVARQHRHRVVRPHLVHGVRRERGVGGERARLHAEVAQRARQSQLGFLAIFGTAVQRERHQVDRRESYRVGAVRCAAQVRERSDRDLAAVIRVTARKDLHYVEPPMFVAKKPKVHEVHDAGYIGFMGVARTIDEATDIAIHKAMTYLCRKLGMTPAEAAILLGVALDLTISEIPDLPNKVVSGLIPLSIFEIV